MFVGYELLHILNPSLLLTLHCPPPLLVTLHHLPPTSVFPPHTDHHTRHIALCRPHSIQHTAHNTEHRAQSTEYRAQSRERTGCAPLW